MKRTECIGNTKTTQDSGTSGTPTTQGKAASDRSSPLLKKPGNGSQGRHVRAAVLEAMEILKGEGYLVGRLSDPEIPFDLMGLLGRAVLLVKVAKGRDPVGSAVEVARRFQGEIRAIQPFWQHDSDNFQFWVFSKVAGLLRYRVYRGGIWNETTRKGPDRKTLQNVPADLKRRSAYCAALPSGLAAGSD